MEWFQLTLLLLGLLSLALFKSTRKERGARCAETTEPTL